MTDKKTFDYVLGGISAMFAAGAATMAYRKRDDLGTALPYTAIGLACAGLASYSLLGADDGLDRLTDSKGRLWAIVPPGAQYRDAEGVLFGNLSKDETFYLRENSKGQPTWLWSAASAIGRHSRRPIVTCKTNYEAVLGRVPTLEEVKNLIGNDVYELSSAGEIVLPPGKLALDGHDDSQFYYRAYDTIS